MTCCGISVPYHTINTLIKVIMFILEILTGKCLQYTSGNSGEYSIHVNTAMADSPDAGSLVSASSQLNLMEVDTVRDNFYSLFPSWSKNGILLSCIGAATHPKEATLLLSVFSKCRSLSIFLLFNHF